MYLSILPNPLADSMESHKPIAPDAPSSRSPHLPDSDRILPRRVSFTRSFKRTASQSSDAITNRGTAKLGIRLAKSDVMLPLVDRPKEVEELLRGSILAQQLRSIHSGRNDGQEEEDEWQALHRLLTATSRSELNDRSWLRAIHAVVFHRSPQLWCQLAECLGAREVRLETEDNSQSGSREQDGAVFQVLNQMPSAFQKQISLVETTSNAQGSARNISSCEEAEAIDALEKHKNAFAGLRISLPSDKTESFPPQKLSRRMSFAGSTPSNNVEFTKHRRLSSLFMPEISERNDKATVSVGRSSALAKHFLRERSRTSPALQGSQRRNETGLLRENSESHPANSIHARPRASTEATKLSTTSVSPTVSPSMKQTSLAASSAEESNKYGLLPDGRTRHPSAGSQDSLGKAALAAFRSELQLTSGTVNSESSSPVSSVTGRHSPASADRAASQSPPWPMPESVFSPSSEASEVPQTPPSIPASIKNLSSSNRDFPGKNADFSSHWPSKTTFATRDVSQSEAFSTKSLANRRRGASPLPSTSIIFPVPPNLRFSRVKILSQQLEKAGNDTNTVEAQAYETLLKVIGHVGIKFVDALVRNAGERHETSDEQLLSRLAIKGFGLVDMDNFSTAAAPSHMMLSAQRRLRLKPWHIHQCKRKSMEDDVLTSHVDEGSFGLAPIFEASSAQEHDDSEESDSDSKEKRTYDHEARMQAYCDDVDAYADRWQAFELLLSDIWQIEDAVIRNVRQRCGPVEGGSKINTETSYDPALTRKYSNALQNAQEA